MKQSLRQRLTILWVALAILAVVLCALIFGLYRQSSDARIAQAREMSVAACERIAAGFGTLRGAAMQPEGAAGGGSLHGLVQQVLREFPGAQGGAWRSGEGFIAYAFPTYEGTGVRTDLPRAEEARLASLAQQSLAGQAGTGFVQRGERGALVAQACPLAGRDSAAWVMIRVDHIGIDAFRVLMFGMLALLVLMLASGFWVARMFAAWGRGLDQVERTLAASPLDQLPTMPLSGDSELDRVMRAVNAFSERLRREYVAAEDLTQKLVQSERMAALGRLASGLAHEIRNPLAAVRLKIENALAEAPGNERAAMTFTLSQVARLERLLSGLLSLTQTLKISPGEVRIDAWLRERLASVQPQAEAAGVTLGFGLGKLPESWTFDPDHLARAVENVLLNAIQHTPRGGRVELGVSSDQHALRIHVQDTGVGIAASVREQIFEPFVTGRENGVGLGLTLARAVLAAHGGTLHNVPVEGGARFEMEIPWHAS